MYPVSQEFQDKVRAYDRKIFGKVQIDYSDPFIDQSVQIVTNENNHTSYPRQIADGVQEPIGKYIALDGTWTLGDDTLVLAPGPGEEEKAQMGWWGSSLSDANGGFSVNPKLIVTFFSRPIRSLKVVGDSKRNEFPVDFVITLYGEGDTILYQEAVTANTQVNWNKGIEQINEVVKMELEISKWNTPNRCVKILEFFTSIQETYSQDDIFSIELLEERETSSGSLPVGNISSNEITIRFNNESKKFDIGNKQSSLYNLIKPGRRIRVWAGMEKDNGEQELVPLGVFWAKNWNIPEQKVYAELVGRDRLESLRNTTFSTSIVEVNKSLYDLAIEVLTDAGLKENEYWVDEELKDIVIPYSYFEQQSHREALRKIAEAGLGQVYCNREGIIRVEGSSFTQKRIENSVVTTFLKAEFPANVEIVDAYGITMDDCFSKSNPSRMEKVANIVEVETQPLRPGAIQEVYQTNEGIPIAAGETKTLTIYFNSTPCIDVSLSIEGTGTIQSSTIYAWGADVVVTSASAGALKIIASGKPLTVQNKDKATAKDNTSIIENGELRYTFPANPLVQDVAMAQNIADKLLAYYKDPKADLNINWIGNPALELGDVVTVYDYYTEEIQERGYYYITKQEFEITGDLRARLEGRRAI